MAIYKRISDLDTASQPLTGAELAEIEQGGVSKKVSLTNIFGSGWWAVLRAAFASFAAPEATHAASADSVGGEYPADWHDASQLTGAVPLASIPVELTGVNAETATLAATATTADSADSVAGVDPVNGNAGTYGTQAIGAGAVWTIPKGTYIFTATNGTFVQLQIKDASSSWFGTAPISGFVISDGVNYRAYNTFNSTAVIYYRKLA